ncbi:MAG: PAS domain-containing protein [Burkholderiales bacterium]|nr:PAS domain-containing protein [Burkholderiales bacterium]
MSSITAAWLVLGSACLTLAAVHAHVWLRQRQAIGNAAFAVLAASVACMGYAETRMLLAGTTAEFGRMLWLYQFPVSAAVFAVVFFVLVYLRAGRAWLGWMAIGLRAVALVVNVFSSPSIQFREITSLAQVSMFGETVAVAQGVPNPLLAIAHLSLVFLLLFVADAIRDLWRRGERRRAFTIGGSIVLFVAAGTLLAVLSFWGIARVPVFATIMFVPIVVAMSFELSNDLIRTARLSADLAAKSAELAASEHKLALAADAASAGLWSIDSATGRVWATPRALAMFGLAPDGEPRLADVLARVHPDDRARVEGFVATAQSAPDRRASVEYRVPGPAGETRWYASHGRAQDTGALPPGTLMGATIDITQRKEAEDAAARQRVELEHLSRVATLSELSGALAHELNQPLAIIMSNAEAAQSLLDRPAPDLPEIRAILADIVKADERAGEVIRRLRSLLKRGEPNRQPLALNQVVRDVVQFMRADLVRRGVTVELALAAGLPEVCADRVPLEQVLINIVGNACDAMAGNGAGDRTVTIATEAAAGAVHLRVRDAGTGLPQAPERVFAPFYTTKEHGLGMGLAICRSIVAAHSGRLWAEVNTDRGATFHLSLPLQAPAA